MIYPKEIFELYTQLKQQKSEIKNIEAKRCLDSVSDSVMQTICAFANESGIEYGYLLLGISEPNEANPTHWVSGVNNPDTVLDQIQTNCRNQFTVVVNIDAGIATIENKTVIAIKVFELDPASKPCGFKSAGKNKKNFSKTGIWRRGINGDYEANVEELQFIFTEKQGLSYENTFLPNASWKDIDIEKITLYRKLRAKVQPNASELEFNDIELLNAFNLIREKDGVIQPNIAGLLLFGSDVALRKHLPMARIDYIRHIGTQWVEESDQRFLYTKDFRESLISVVPRLEGVILDDMPNYFNLEENALQRSDQSILPQRVVREAVVNMLMHRDYSQNQPSQINRFSNRLELQNAGYSLKNIDDLGSPKSITRNPLIATVLYDLRYAETKGSGINTMRKKLKEAKLTPPVFYSNQDDNQFRAVFLLQHLMQEEQLNWLKLFADYELSYEESSALILAKETGYVDNSGLREITGLDTLSSSKLLVKLRKKELLIMLGKGQHTYYVLSDLAKDKELEQLNRKPENLITKPEELIDKPEELIDKPEEFIHKPEELFDKPEEFIDKSGELLMLQLQGLAKKATKDKVHQIILILCMESATQAESIAKALNRNLNYVRTAYLAPLLKEELLTYKFLETPNHPEQAYLITQKGREWLKQKGIEL